MLLVVVVFVCLFFSERIACPFREKPVPLLACILLFVGVCSDTISNSKIDLSHSFQLDDGNVISTEWIMFTKRK